MPRTSLRSFIRWSLPHLLWIGLLIAAWGIGTQQAKATAPTRPLPQPTATPADPGLVALAQCAENIADVEITRQAGEVPEWTYFLRVLSWIKRSPTIQVGPVNVSQFRNDQFRDQPMIDLSAPQEHWILFMGGGANDAGGSHLVGVRGAYGIKNGVITTEGVFSCGSAYPQSYLGWPVTRFLAAVRAIVQPAARLPNNGHAVQDAPALLLLLALLTLAGGILLRRMVPATHASRAAIPGSP
jgi:hypothetical protein